MLCQLKQIDQLNKGRDQMAITAVEEVLHMSSYPLIEYMGFGTDIYDGVEKMRAATLLREILRLNRRTKIH